MRYKVELAYGSASFSESDLDKALDLYNLEGIRLFKCKDIFDPGTLISGPPVVQDLTEDFKLKN